MTLTTSDQMETLARDYEALTAPDIHVDGRLHRALIEPLATFLGKPDPFPNMTLTTSAFYDKAKAFHPGPEWYEDMRRLAPGQGSHPAVVSFSLWHGGGMTNELYAYGATIEIAYCAAVARVWGWVLRLAGR